jgi:uncharacterized protein
VISKPPGSGTKARRPKGAPGNCPVCGKPVMAEYRPFCSRKCADIDLSRWLEGRYVVPGEPIGKTPEEDEDL